MLPRRILSPWIAALALAVSFAAACAPAPAPVAKPAPGKPTTAEEIFAYMGPDRQQLLEEGAKKEGKVLLYTTWTIDTRARPLAEAFNKKYPFVTVEYVRLDQADISKRAIEEYQAKRYDLDVVEAGFSTIAFLKPTGVLAKYSSPLLNDLPKEVQDPEAYWVADRENPLVLTFNANKVPEAEGPKTWEDILAPKWKGNLATNDTGQAVAYLGALLQFKGEEYVRKLAKQDVVVYSQSSDGVIGLVASGEATSSFPASLGNVLSFKKQGRALGYAPMEKTPTSLGYLAVVSRAAHPHATAMFVDWLLSEEGQKAMVATGEGGVRKDVMTQYSEIKMEKFYMDLAVPQKEYTDHFKKWQGLFTELLGAGRKPGS